jgi:hypothetical protein
MFSLRQNYHFPDTNKQGFKLCSLESASNDAFKCILKDNTNKKKLQSWVPGQLFFCQLFRSESVEHSNLYFIFVWRLMHNTCSLKGEKGKKGWRRVEGKG